MPDVRSTIQILLVTVVMNLIIVISEETRQRKIGQQQPYLWRHTQLCLCGSTWLGAQHWRHPQCLLRYRWAMLSTDIRVQKAAHKLFPIWHVFPLGMDSCRHPWLQISDTDCVVGTRGLWLGWQHHFMCGFCGFYDLPLIFFSCLVWQVRSHLSAQ